MKNRLFIFLIAGVLVASTSAAEARFFGNLPESAPPDQQQQSRDLANRSLTAIAHIFSGLAEFEVSGNVQSINNFMAESAGIFKELADRYRDLAGEIREFKVSPEEAAKRWPTIENILRDYDQNLGEVSTLTDVARKMADEQARLAQQLSTIRFTGEDDHQTAIALYDALNRVVYLAAAYAAINHTASQ